MLIDWVDVGQAIINGLLIGGLYGLTALGLGLIWGVMKVVNLAHGVFIMLGAYTSYWLFELLHLHPALSAPLAFGVGCGIGYLLYRTLLDRLLVSATSDLEGEMLSLILTFALAAIIYGGALNIWGSDLRGLRLMFPTLTVGAFDIPTSRLAAFLAALLLGGALHQFLRRTYLGKAIRAVTHNRTAAMLSGINPAHIFGLAMSIGLGYAMMAGVIVSLTIPVTPLMGVNYLLKSFTVVALGGLGNPLGAFAGGLILGLAESGTSLVASYALSPAVAFILLILILVAKPTGLFGALR